MNSLKNIHPENQSVIDDEVTRTDIYKVEYDDYFSQHKGMMDVNGDSDGGGDGDGSGDAE